MDEAIACYQQGHRARPEVRHGPHQPGQSRCIDKGQLDEAIACYTKAIELDPKHAKAHNNLGNALQDKGQVDEAIACYKKAIELDPKLAKAHTNLGNALQDKGQLDEAIACYKQGHRTRPEVRPAPTATWAMRCGTRARWTRPSPATRRPSNSTRRTPWPSTGLREGGATGSGPGQAPRLPGRQLHARRPTRNASAWPSGARSRSCITPRPACTPTPSPPTPSWPTTWRPRTATTPPASPRWPPPARARTPPSSTTRSGPACGSRPSTGSAPTWPCAPRWRASPPTAPRLQQTLRHWQKDTDLAGIRDAAALAKLPADERKAFAQLWADVAALLKKANRPPSHASLQEQLPEARKALPNDSPQLAGLLAQIGLGMLEQKRWTEAEPLLRQCQAIRERLSPMSGPPSTE